jgi:translation initiation factor IF-3
MLILRQLFRVPKIAAGPPLHRSRPPQMRRGMARAQRNVAPTAAAPEPLLNEAVARIGRVQLISEAGDDCGEMSGEAALRRARQEGRDILAVRKPGPRGDGAVVRIVDYGSMKEAQQRSSYAARKKQKETARDGRRATVLKQVRLSPSTGEHDFSMKIRQARRFLLDGHRVRVFMQFRRGQGRLQDDAKTSLVRTVRELAECGTLAGGAGGSASKSMGLIEVADLFPKPAVDDEDEVSALARPKTRMKPLEVLLQPMRKSEREKLLASHANKEGSSLDDRLVDDESYDDEASNVDDKDVDDDTMGFTGSNIDEGARRDADVIAVK